MENLHHFGGGRKTTGVIVLRLLISYSIKLLPLKIKFLMHSRFYCMADSYKLFKKSN